MVGRRHTAATFRPSTVTGAGRAPSRVQAVALLSTLVVVAAGIAIVSFVVRPSKARSFDLFHGSVFINDNTNPVSVDLASGKPTVRLTNGIEAVSGKNSGELVVYPLGGGNSLLLDNVTGAFNMIDSTGFVVKTTGGGVRLPASGPARAVAAGDAAYIMQSSDTKSAFYLVSQLTVASAIGENAKAKARAYAKLNSPVGNMRNPAATAGDDLWLLTGSGPGANDPHSITELSLPAGSNTGATLKSHPQGAIRGTGAVETATRNADGSGGSLAAVASSDAVRVFTADGSTSLPVTGVGTGVDQILAASNSQGEFVFLYHSSAGWSRVTVPVKAGSARVTALDPLRGARWLATPAMSDGHLYTMSDNGDMWQIESNGSTGPVPGAHHYPVVAGEAGGLTSSEIIARGSRVIFNSRSNLIAEVVFSDGSRPPHRINKGSGVPPVDASGATSLTAGRGRGTTKPGKPTGKPTTKTPHPAQAVNDKVDCKTTTQIPHIPTLQLLERGSRSVGLQWSYPLLSPDDCAPSTYTVGVKKVSSGGPGAPSTVTVQGQDSVTLTGLFPDTEYELDLTAFINKKHTSSIPLRVRTDVEGPAAPTSVRTSVDDAGNWVVHWNNCGGLTAACIPVADWQIIPRFCDGQGLSSAPATLHLTGDPTLHSFTIPFQGNDSLLGRGLSFTVEGLGTRGTVGTPASDKSCSYSWTRPVRDAITVKASAPAGTSSSQATTQTTVSVSFAHGQVHDLGGVGGQLNYELLSGGSVVSRSGPTTQPTATLGGITAGRTYQVVVRVNPPRHPDAAVSVGPVDVQPAIADWPKPTVDTSFTTTSATQGTLTVTVGLGGADARGETFDLTNSTLNCANSQAPLNASDIAPGHSVSFPDIDRFTYRNDCTVTIQLVQNGSTATNPPLYGAGPSQSVTSGSFTIPPPSVTTSKDDFSASWSSSSGSDNPQVVVSYHGQDQLAFSRNWTISVSNGSRTCGSTDQAPTVTIDVDKLVRPRASDWTVTIDYQYFLSNPHFTIDVNGTAPAPVDPSKITFDPATWDGDATAPQVVVHYTGSYDSSTLRTLNWTETVTSNGNTCGTSNATPGANSPQIDIDYTTCPPTVDDGTGNQVPQTYTITIHYDDPNYGGSHDYTPLINGTPPQ